MGRVAIARCIAYLIIIQLTVSKLEDNHQNYSAYLTSVKYTYSASSS